MSNITFKMPDENPKSSESQGDSQDKPSGGVKSVRERFAELSTLQKDRFHMCFPIYGDSSLEIIDHFKGKRTPGQWVGFWEAAKVANQDDHPEYAYLVELAGKFEIGTSYYEYDIVPVISALRLKFELPLFTSNIGASSIGEIKRVFLIDEKDSAELIPVLGLMASN